MLGHFQPTPSTDDWLEDLRSVAREHRRLLLQDPWAITPLFAHPAPGLNAVRIGEVTLRVLRRAGITGEAAVATFSGILAMNYGWAAFTAARDGARPDRTSRTPALRDVPAALPSDEYPLTVEVADSMANYGSEAHYELALHQLLVGIQAPGGSNDH